MGKKERILVSGGKGDKFYVVNNCVFATIRYIQKTARKSQEFDKPAWHHFTWETADEMRKVLKTLELIIAELSRYIIVILFALYTFYSYRAFIGRAAGNNEGVFRAQRVLIVMLHLVCSAVILVEEKEIKYVILWALELFFFLFFYENLSGVLQRNVKTNLE